jgi:hypothetical protein
MKVVKRRVYENLDSSAGPIHPGYVLVFVRVNYTRAKRYDVKKNLRFYEISV